MNRKTKTILSGAIAFLLVITFVGLIVGLTRRKNPNAAPDSPSEIPQVYTINYLAVENGKVTGVYTPLFKSDGVYPVCYTVGEEFTVSDLYGRTNRTPVPESWGFGSAEIVTGVFQDPYNGRRDFEFLGWFLDDECTQAFTRSAMRELCGDVVLFAKLSVGYWTAYY